MSLVQGGQSGLRPGERILRSSTPVIPVQPSLAGSEREERYLVAQKDLVVDSQLPGVTVTDGQSALVRVTRDVEIKLDLLPHTTIPVFARVIPAVAGI